MKEKEYELKTFAQIDEVVNENNVGAFLTDFSRWVGILIATRGRADIKIKNRDTFHWYDDGKTDIKSTIEILTPES